MPHTRAELSRDLRALGLEPGAQVMVHASLRRIGPVEGRAQGLIEAIVETIGPEGTMMMVLGADSSVPFDAAKSPVDTDEMGFLAEAFRTFDGVQVNDHASDRFAAIGPRAHAFIHAPPLHDYLGPNSPLDRFRRHRGQVLRLGADIDTVTLTHLAEYLAHVENKRRVRRRYERADVGEQWIESLDDSDGIADWPHGDYFSEILRAYLASGIARTGTVGSCEAQLLDGQSFLCHAVQWMEQHL